MCTALLLDETYPPTKFQRHSYYTFGDELRAKFKYDNKQRAITQKLSKQELQFMCTALSLGEIYPPTKSITIASIVLEICSRQKSSMKITKIKYENNKGQ